jgi:hypothetical protein
VYGEMGLCRHILNSNASLHRGDLNISVRRAAGYGLDGRGSIPGRGK